MDSVFAKSEVRMEELLKNQELMLEYAPGFTTSLREEVGSRVC